MGNSGRSRREPVVYAVVLIAAMIGLGMSPSADRLTWLLENFPVMIAVPLLIITHRRFPLTDRLGHFMQGFVPALLAREILLRRTPLRRGPWLVFLVLSIALAISASYELIEWAAALFAGEAADAFLGTQGDQWDTQWDMFLALVGASISLMLLSNAHDRQLPTVGLTGPPGRAGHADV
jgi:putative membrane protein